MCSANMGKAGTSATGTSPARRCPGPTGSSLAAWPIWLSGCEGRRPVGSQIALHGLGPPLSWKPRNLSWASRWGRLRQGKGGCHLWDQPAWGHGSGRPSLAPGTPRAETLAGSTGAWPSAAGTGEVAPGIGRIPGVRLGDPRAAVLRAGSDSIENRVLSGPGGGVCGPGPASGRFWGRGHCPLHMTHSSESGFAVRRCIRYHYTCHLIAPYRSPVGCGIYIYF